MAARCVGTLLSTRVLLRNSLGCMVQFESGMVETDGAGTETVCAWRDVIEVRRLSRIPVVPMDATTAAGRRLTVSRDDFARCRPLLKDIVKLPTPASTD
ncbi:hypothetical protein [Streptomyces sp. NPDC126522]|uniref:hypothetical protein n=1 Tax=Streptomyces sp. NPDC126522 TaxID=3155211 RepID=UPI00332EAE05